MPLKGLRHSLIFIKVRIPLKKLVLLKYTRNKLHFLPPTGPSSYIGVPEEIPR